MMHRINLKGPWTFTPLNTDGGSDAISGLLPTGGTAKFPANWQEILGDFRGSVKFTRPFNRPTNLDSTERVELVLDGIGGTAEVTLNQRRLGLVGLVGKTARFDVTQSLSNHNLLEITIRWEGHETEPGGLWAPVALEITTA